MILELGFEVAPDPGDEIEQRVVAAGRAFAFLPRNFESHDAGEALHGLDEIHMVVLHQEIERVAVCSAAETVIKALRRTHRKRRRFLIMERAASLEFLAGFLELHTAPDDLDRVGAVDQIDDKLLWNASAHSEINAARLCPGFARGSLLLWCCSVVPVHSGITEA